MDNKIESVILPVSDVDRAKAFYAEQVGFNVDHDQRVDENLRFVQLTPPGSACFIAFGEGLVDTPPGSVHGLQVVVDDASPRTRTTTPPSTRQPHSAHSTCTLSVPQVMTMIGSTPYRRRARLGTGRLESGCHTSSRWPWLARLADACGSVVAIVRDEAATPMAPETTHARSSNCPVHDEASLDVRGSECTSCFLRAGRKHDLASADGVVRVQGTARRYRPDANCYAVPSHGTSLARPRAASGHPDDSVPIAAPSGAVRRRRNVRFVFGSGKRFFGSIDSQLLLEDPAVVVRGQRDPDRGRQAAWMPV